MNNMEIRRGIKTMLSMAPEQLNYVKAKALYDTLKARYVTEGQQVVEETQFWAAVDARLEAEKALIEWARNFLQTHRPQEYARVKDAFEKPIYSGGIRQKLVNICFRLDAGTV